MRTWCTLASLLILQASGPVDGKQTQHIPDARPAALLRAIQEIAERNHIAAVSYVLVDRHGLIAHETFGLAERKTMRPATRQTRFRVGSISKSFTGLAALRAQKRGLLNLSDPAARWLPESTIRNRYPQHPVRLSHLLEHTAGWFDLSGAEFDHSASPPVSLEQALAVQPDSRTTRWPAGQHHEYSNTGAGVFSAALERACACPFESFIKAQVFEPLSMSTASLLPDQGTLAQLAQGYDGDGHTPITYWNILYRAAGGLNLNPQDMAPFLRMLLNDGRVGDLEFLTQGEVERFETPTTSLAAQAGLRLGYGLGIRQYLHRGHRLFGHGGDADGYLSHFAYSRESGRAYFVVITAFQNDSISRMETRLADWIVAPLSARKAPPEKPVSPEFGKQLSGSYHAASTRFPASNWRSRSIDVVYRDGRLYTISKRGKSNALFRVDGLHFRRRQDSEASTAFIRRGDQTFLQGPMGNWRKNESAPVLR